VRANDRRRSFRPEASASGWEGWVSDFGHVRIASLPAIVLRCREGQLRDVSEVSCWALRSAIFRARRELPAVAGERWAADLRGNDARWVGAGCGIAGT
jgi:hypothetical protein